MCKKYNARMLAQLAAGWPMAGWPSWAGIDPVELEFGNCEIGNYYHNLRV